MAQAHLKRIFNYAGVQPDVQKHHFKLLKDSNAANHMADKLNTPGYKTSEDKKNIVEANKKVSAAESEVRQSFAGIVASVNGQMEAAAAKAIKFYQTAYRVTVGVATTAVLGFGGWFANTVTHLSTNHLLSAPINEQIAFFTSIGGAVLSGIAGFFVARLFNKKKENAESTSIEIEHTLKGNNGAVKEKEVDTPQQKPTGFSSWPTRS